MGQPRQTYNQAFNQASGAQISAPPGPTVSPDPVRGMRVSFPDTLRTMGEQADLVMIGDTNHDNVNIRNAVGQRESVVALAEGGVSQIMLEVPEGSQPLADKFVSGEFSKDEFTRRFNIAQSVSQGNEDGAWGRNVADMIETGQRVGVDVKFADPGNGTANLIENEMQKDAAWEEYAAIENPTDAQKSAQIDRINGLTERGNDIFANERTMDTQLAGSVNDGLQSGKVALVYGSAHGSRFGDLEEFVDGQSLKIDVYQNRDDMMKGVDAIRNDAQSGLRHGEDVPDLIYTLDDQTVYTTAATPPALARELESRAAESPAPKPDSPEPQNRYVPSAPGLGM